MIFRGSLFLIVIILISLSGCNQTKTPVEIKKVLYGNESSSFNIIFRGDRVLVGPLTEEELSNLDHLFGIKSEHVFNVTAPSSARCLVFSQTILATPKILKEGARYECAGAKFVVEDCLESINGQCQKAVVGVNCASTSERKCLNPVPPFHFMGIAMGAPYYFIYAKNRGIVDIIMSNDFSVENRHLTLKGDKGVI